MSFEPTIRKHGASDYGLYGGTGSGIATEHGIPLKLCPKCHTGRAVITYQYDDTPGFRETVYWLDCESCGYQTGATSWLAHLIGVWNGTRSADDRSPIRE